MISRFRISTNLNRFVLNRYLLVRVLIPMSLALFIILSALSLERLLRLVDIVAAENAPLSEAAKMLFYLQPHYLGLALPAALFISVILAVRQMNESSELVVMQAAGIPYSRMIYPILGFSLIIMLIMLILTSYFQPHGRYVFRATLQDLQASGQTLRLQPDVFHQINDNITLRVDAVGKNGRLFKGFFAEYIAPDGTKTLATSELSEIYNDPATHESSLDLTLTNAKIVTAEPGKSARIITTQSYPLNLDIGPTEAYGARGQNKRELTYGELLQGGVPGILIENDRSELMAEFHLRLVQSLSLPVLALLAIPLGLMGQGRTGKASGIITGIILLILYEKTLGFMEVLAAERSIPAFVALWTPFFVLLAGTLAFMMYKTGEFKSFRHKAARKNSGGKK